MQAYTLPVIISATSSILTKWDMSPVVFGYIRNATDPYIIAMKPGPMISPLVFLMVIGKWLVNASLICFTLIFVSAKVGVLNMFEAAAKIVPTQTHNFRHKLPLSVESIPQTSASLRKQQRGRFSTVASNVGLTS